jgi:nicotinamidase-related amidase
MKTQPTKTQPPFRIRKDSLVAVMVDIQEKLFPHIHDHDALGVSCAKLTGGLQALSVPIFVTEQYVKGLGRTTKPLQDALGDLYSPIEKLTFSCCGSQEFVEVIDNLSRNYVLLYGIEAHICVLQTALDLREMGYTPVIVEDCVGTRHPSDKAVALKRMRKAGCIITTMESILFELCVIAGTETFKKISALVK